MKIFLSHCSRDKPLLREIRQFLPKFLSLWIDEIEIPYGANLSYSIKTAIQKKTDLLVIFLAPEAVESDWVKRELKWALEREKKEKRNFIIPVLLNKKCWEKVPRNFKQRKYIPFEDYTLDNVEAFSKRLYNELFSYFLQSIEFLSEYELENRRVKASEIARYIKNDQSTAIGNEVLTKKLLKEIISNIDPLNRILLLALYELMFVSPSDINFRRQLEERRYLSIEFDVPNLGYWVHKIDWISKSSVFSKLNSEYKLGDKQFLVKDVFMNGINKLSDSEREKLFYGIKIMHISPEG